MPVLGGLRVHPELFRKTHVRGHEVGSPDRPLPVQPLPVSNPTHRHPLHIPTPESPDEEYGDGDQPRQFQPVYGHQDTSTASQSAFDQDRPTEQQKYPLSPAAWSASTSQPVIQCPTPPNESPQITQHQLNLLPDLQPVPPMPPSLDNPILAAMYAQYELEISTPLDHLPSSLFSDRVYYTQRGRAMGTLSTSPGPSRFTTRLQLKAVKGILPLPSAPVTQI